MSRNVIQTALLILVTEVWTKCAPLHITLIAMLLGRLPPNRLTCPHVLLVTLTRPVFGRGTTMLTITGLLPPCTMSCKLLGSILVCFMLRKWTTPLLLCPTTKLPNLAVARTSFNAWTDKLTAPFLTSLEGSLMPLVLIVPPILNGATLQLVTPTGLSYRCTEQCPRF